MLAQSSQAQGTGFKKFAEGSYVLADNRAVRYPGQIKLQSGSKLVIKTPDGTTVKLKPAQLYSFIIGQRQYTTARDFRVQGGFGTDVDEAFVEQLDSGQVMLMRYDYTVGSPMMMGAGGAMTGGGVSAMSAYLLRRPTDSTYVSVQPAFYSFAGGNRFRDAVRPFLAGHPDLLKLLDEKRITMDNLPAVIRALNAGKPYQLPLSHYEFMKQQALAKQAKKAASDSTRH
ncbi:hypothetical protein QMK33_15570 [Hymenobacter sp. H14-R3]|uniref:hypothetical protein n=1 Tax=Hymenobacter sp. H14-R3 TaxID=3046308 RepID=UPI0024BAABDE|nr:hypothetical protein [Hymenobacter sp. H14-R3]MDJ0366578.1 hypothetical protein [Hymenobacter sp. H14-R3]